MQKWNDDPNRKIEKQKEEHALVYEIIVEISTEIIFQIESNYLELGNKDDKVQELIRKKLAVLGIENPKLYDYLCAQVNEGVDEYYGIDHIDLDDDQQTLPQIVTENFSSKLSTKDTALLKKSVAALFPFFSYTNPEDTESIKLALENMRILGLALKDVSQIIIYLKDLRAKKFLKHMPDDSKNDKFLVEESPVDLGTLESRMQELEKLAYEIYRDHDSSLEASDLVNIRQDYNEVLVEKDEYVKFMLGSIDLEEFENELKIFESKKRVDFNDNSKNYPSLFNPSTSAEAVVILKKLFTEYLERNQALISTLSGIQITGDFDIQKIVEVYVHELREAFSNTVNKNLVLIDFLQQSQLTNKEKFVTMIVYLNDRLLLNNSEYKKRKKKHLSTVDISDYGIDSKTFRQLESWYISYRKKGVENLLSEFLYGKIPFGQIKVLLDGKGLRFNNYYGDTKHANRMVPVIKKIIDEFIEENGVKLSGRGVAKAEEILKKFIEDFMILDLRKFRL